MRVETKRFGTVEVDQSKIVHFPDGLVGFNDYKNYVVLDSFTVEGALCWLQSVDEPSLGFLALSPSDIFEGYCPEFVSSDLAGLGQESPCDLIMLSIITVPPDARKMTANLQAPLLVNPSKRLGKQVIVGSAEYSTKHYVFSHLEKYLRRIG